MQIKSIFQNLEETSHYERLCAVAALSIENGLHCLTDSYGWSE